MKEIDSAFSSDYKHIILEGPTGFGKSAVAITAALTLGSSYILTSTKNLQTQYARDFPFVRVVKGKNNFRCEVKDDFIKNGTFRCKPCGSVGLQQGCYHTSVKYGPCMNDRNFDCIYKTSLKDYQAIDRGTKDEMVLLSEEHYRDVYSEWSHLDNLRKDVIRDWRPCRYFHQLNIASAAAHSVLNYAIFLGLINGNIPSRELLVFDEVHMETEFIKFREIAISRKKWRKYIPDLIIDNHGYDDIEGSSHSRLP